MVDQSKKEILDEFLKSLSGKKVLVWGLGLNGGGIGVAKFFATHDALVKVTDLKTEAELADALQELKKFPNIEYTLGEHKEEDFLWADTVMRNPAIPPRVALLDFLKKHDKTVWMEFALFLKYCPGKVIGVTGTRGKTTTTALLTEMLKVDGKKVTTGGNNKIPLLSQLEEIDEDTFVVVEMSSFQLASLDAVEASPHLTVVTNMYPDHLNWHPDMDDYIESKAHALRFQGKDDFAVINADNATIYPRFTEVGDARKLTFGAEDSCELRIVEASRIEYEGKPLIDTSEMKLKGVHNLYNFAGAALAALQLGVSLEVIAEVGRNFESLPYRQEKIGTHKGITFINDTTATTPEGLFACLERFSGSEKKKVHLIIGGVDKSLNMSQIPDYLEKHTSTVHFFEGTFYDNIKKLLTGNLLGKVFGPFNTMNGAFDSALSQAKSGDYVVLSPCASSFNMFKNEFDRGDQFNEMVSKLSA